MGLWKGRPKSVAQPIFSQILNIILTVEKWGRQLKKINTQRKLSPKRRKFAQSGHLGVDVMITIFCDFQQFSAKNGVFLKNQCYDQNFA
jgi:FAD synthase